MFKTDIVVNPFGDCFRQCDETEIVHGNSLVFHDTQICQADRSKSGFLLLAIVCVDYLMKYT